MKAVTFLERALQKAVSPLPASARALLRATFYRVAREHLDGMRSSHPQSEAMLGGLRELTEYLKKHGVQTMVEVGSHTGESTEVFAKVFGKIHAVDPWQFARNIERAFDRRMAPYPQVQKWKMTSAQAALHFADASLDAVYIDADHHESFVRQDITLWLPKVRPGGILAGHDYSPSERGVLRAVDVLFGKPDKVFADTSWIKHIV